MNLKVLRLAGLFGMLAPLLGLLVIAGSVWLSPWFSWTGNALSDIGGSDGLEAIIFNSGLAMVGALMMMYSTGLFELTKEDLMGQVGSMMFLIASVLLIAIGVINITIVPWHTYVSVAFFVALPLSVAIVGVFLLRKKMRFYSLLSIGTAVLATVMWLLPWAAVAIPEALSVTYIGVWAILLGHWMFTRFEDKLAE